jgi:hypothetical protein
MPKLPPSLPLSIAIIRAFGGYPADYTREEVKALNLKTIVADAPALSYLTAREG